MVDSNIGEPALLANTDEIWSYVREAARADDQDRLAALTEPSFVQTISDELPVGAPGAPSPAERIRGLILAAKLNSWTRGSLSERLHDLGGAVSSLRSPGESVWAPREIPGSYGSALEYVSELYRYSVRQPGLVVVGDLLRDISGAHRPGRSVSVPVLVSHHVEGDVVDLQLTERPGPPGIYPDLRNAPFVTWDESFEHGLQTAWRAIGDPTLSVRWTPISRRSTKPVKVIGGPSVGLGAAMGLMAMRDGRPVLPGTAFTGRIADDGRVGSLLAGDGALGSYPAKLRALPPTTVVLPASDGHRVGSWAEQNQILATLDPVESIDRARRHLGEPAEESRDGSEVCPYRGLEGFGTDDSKWFYGREALTSKVVGEIATADLVAVLGPSGAGKSSLIRAGVIPALESGALPGSEDWPVVQFEPGASPTRALTRALASSEPGEDSDDSWLDGALDALLVGHHPASRAVLIVDQLEQIYAGDEADQFLSLVARAANRPRVTVVIVMRADAFGQVANVPAFVDLVTENQVVVGPMTPTELRRAITKPAEQAGLLLEERLVETALDDVAEQPGGLPLLSTALQQTWERRSGRHLTLAGYQEAGEVAGALRKLADRLYDDVDTETRSAIKDLLMRMVVHSERNTGSINRRVVPLAELNRSESHQIALERLATHRLIRIGTDSAEISHDSLLERWPQLQNWLAENRDNHLVRQQVAEATGAWIASAPDSPSQRDQALLLRGRQLEAAAELHALEPESLTGAERELIDLSIGRDRRAKRQRLVTVGVVVGLAVAVLAAGLLALQRQDLAAAEAERADAEQERADAEAALAQEERDRADESAAWSAFSADEVLVRGLADASQQEASRDLDLALLLAVESLTISQARSSAPDGSLPETDDAAVGALAEVLQHTSRLDGFLHGDERIRRAVDISPDGSRVVAGSDNGTVAFWDVPSRTLLGTPIDAHHGGEVRGIAVNAAGELAASGGEDGGVQLWDLKTGEPFGEPLVPTSLSETPVTFDSAAVPAIAFDPTGAYLATGDRSGNIVVWDIASRSPVAELVDRGLVLGLDFTPDGETLGASVTVGGQDGTFSLWDWQSGELLAAPEGYHNGFSNDFSFSPSGDHFITCSQDRTVAVWRLDQVLSSATPSPTQYTVHDNGVLSCQWLDDGTTIVSAGGTTAAVTYASADPDAFMAFLDEGGEPLSQDITAHTGVVADASASEDATTMVSVGTDGHVVLWDLEGSVSLGRRLLTTEESLWSKENSGPGVALSSDGTVAVAGKSDGRLWFWETSSGEVIAGPIDAHGNGIWEVEFSTDSALVFSGSSDTTVGIWDSATGRPVGDRFDGHLDTLGATEFTAVYDIAPHPAGEVVASCDNAGGLIVWEVETRRIRWRTERENRECGVEWAPDGSSLYFAHGLSIEQLDGETGDPIGEVMTGQHTEPIFSLTLSGDGTQLVSGGRDTNLVAWDVAAQAVERGPLTRYAQTPHDVAHAEDTLTLGPTVLASIRNGSVELTDAETGVRRLLLDGHENGVWRIGIDEPARQAITGDFNGSVILWRLDLKSWLRQACDAANRNLTAAEWDRYLPGREYRATCP